MTDDHICSAPTPEVHHLLLPAMTEAELKALAVSTGDDCACYFSRSGDRTFLVRAPAACVAHPVSAPVVARRWDEALALVSGVSDD